MMATTELRSGTIGGVDWSEDEDRDVLYDLARDQQVPTSGSDATKDEIVVALLGASDPPASDEAETEDDHASAPEGEVQVEVEVEAKPEDEAEAEDQADAGHPSEPEAVPASEPQPAPMTKPFDNVAAQRAAAPGSRPPSTHAARHGGKRTEHRPSGGARKVHGSGGGRKI